MAVDFTPRSKGRGGVVTLSGVSPRRGGQCALDGPAVLVKTHANGRSFNAGQSRPFRKRSTFPSEFDQAGSAPLSLSDGFSHRPLNRPAAPDSFVEHESPDAKQTRPASQGQRFASVGVQLDATPIIRLLKGCCPAAIVGFVSSRVVDSIQRMPLRARPHISEERFEGVAPLSTHSNALGAVARIWPVTNVIATPLRLSPRDVCWRTRHAMRAVACGGNIAQQTSATASHTTNERTTVIDAKRSAFAVTVPGPLSPRVWLFRCGSEHGKPSELHTGDQPMHRLIVTETRG